MPFKKRRTAATVQHADVVGPHWSSNPWAGGQQITVTACSSYAKFADSSHVAARRHKSLVGAQLIVGLSLRLTFHAANTSKQTLMFNTAGRAGPFDEQMRADFALECIAEAIRVHGAVPMHAGPPPKLNMHFYLPLNLTSINTAPQAAPQHGWLGNARLDLALDNYTSESDCSSDSEADVPAPEPELGPGPPRPAPPRPRAACLSACS